MAYQPPELQALLVLAVQLKQNYSGQNAQRTSFITLLEHLIAETEGLPAADRTKLLLGTYMFELERIENEYRLFSPERSSAYRLIKQRLNFTPENVLTEEQRMIYLAQFYNHVRSHVTPDFVKGLHWRTKDGLLDDIKNSIHSLLSKQTESVQELLQSPPEPAILHDNLTKIEEKYRAVHDQRWFANPSRLSLIEFIKFVNQSADRLYDDQDDENMNDNISYMVRLGAMVFAMMKIENEYYARSPENSELYRLCQEMTNVNDLAGLSTDKKILWLTELSRHIQKLLLHHRDITQDAKDTGFREVDVYLPKVKDKLARYIAKLTKEQHLPQGMLGRAGAAASMGVSYGSSQVATRLIVPSVGGMMVDAGAGVVGTAVFGPAGGLVAVPLSRFVRDKVIPDAMANAFAMVLERIGYALGRQAVGVVTVPFVATAAGLRQLLGLYNEFYPHEENPIENEEWIKALMSLPDDVFEQSNKALVERTHGLMLQHQSARSPVVTSDPDEAHSHQANRL